MPMSTYCTRALLAAVLITLSGCSQHSGLDRAEGGGTAAASAEDGVERYQQALAHLNRNELDQAEAILRPYTQQHPDLAGPWANLGLIEIKRNRIEEAERRLKTALERNPKLPQALNLLGLVESRKGNFRQAEALYSQAIAHKGDYALAHYNLALLYDVYLQDVAKAVPHYEHYLQLIDHKDEATASLLKRLKARLNRDQPS